METNKRAIAQKIKDLKNGKLFTNLSGCIHLDDNCSYNTVEVQFWIENGKVMKIVNHKNCHNGLGQKQASSQDEAMAYLYNEYNFTDSDYYNHYSENTF